MELPFFGSPLTRKAGTIGKDGAVETVPITVSGVGAATPWEPHPASAAAPSSAAAPMSARRGTAQDSNEALRPPAQQPVESLLLTTIRGMQRRSFGRDRGLSLRMLFTGGLLGLLYVLFGVALFYFLNVGLAPLLVIVVGLAFFQYYTSDKIALAASGAKVVTAEEAPD